MFSEEIAILLELYTIDEVLDVLEITQEECLEILLVGGHVKLPPFLEDGGYNGYSR